MTILIGDRRVVSLPVHDCGDDLVDLGPLSSGDGGPGRLVRSGVAARLHAAADRLPAGTSLRVVEGYRSATAQQGIIDAYAGDLGRQHPGASPADLEVLLSRYVAPLANAPHLAGAAVDLTLVDDGGHELWMGCPLDATPEQSSGRCWFGAANLDRLARRNRALLGTVLGAEGLVNYPTEWWHWSFGDRYWAHAVGAAHAIYGPVLLDTA